MSQTPYTVLPLVPTKITLVEFCPEIDFCQPHSSIPSQYLPPHTDGYVELNTKECDIGVVPERPIIGEKVTSIRKIVIDKWEEHSNSPLSTNSSMLKELVKDLNREFKGGIINPETYTCN